MDVRQLQKTWDRLARIDPLWSILADPQKKGGRWQLSEFFKTGQEEIAGLMLYVESLQIKIGHRRALDFGSGIGRLTQPLAGYFDEVHGVDIAPTMIALANKYNHQVDKCQYHLIEKDDLTLFPDDTFDLIYSNLTLQHMEKKYCMSYMREFLRVLARGGLVIFQLPSEMTSPLLQFANSILRGPVRALYTGIRYGIFLPRLEMHGLKRNDTVKFLESIGARVIDIKQDYSAGKGWVGYRYCATK
jgi:ubiquinone/menaquinone biosynthesis C-methylase UbiE